jgi:hypothetical protein
MPGNLVVTPGSIWATTLYSTVWPDQAAEAPAIIAHLYELKSQLAANIGSGIALSAKSRQGLYESSFDLLASPHPALARLKAFFEDALRLAISHVNGSKDNPRLIRPRITESWFHITNDGGFHDAHYHNQCSWCGIYYAQAGECTPTDDSGPGNGVNRFFCPLPSGGAYIDYGNSYLNSNRADIVPQDGLLILFPSYLLHNALSYRGQTDRITISFNSQAILERDAKG